MKKLFVVSLFSLLSGLAVNTQMAKANSEVDEIFNDMDRITHAMCQMRGMENCEFYSPEYKQRIDNLIDDCFQGNQAACNEYNREVREYEEKKYGY